MLYILLIILFFMAAVAAHVLFCRRTTKPGLHAKAFIMIAFFFLGVFSVLAAALPLDPHSLWGLPFKITAGVIFMSLIPIYLSFYVLTQLISPSQKILLTIAAKGELSRPEILAILEKEDFINTRLHDLCASGCVTQTGDLYVLSPPGQGIVLILNLMQGAFGRRGGG
jgi:hypothetical protein